VARPPGPAPPDADGDVVRDPGDPRLAPFVGLRDGDRRVRRPPGTGSRGTDAFVTEGALLARRALAAGHRPLAMLADVRAPVAVPPGLPPGVPVHRAEAGVLRAVTGLGVVREVVGLWARPPERTAAEVLGGARRVVVLEGVVNPVNLGGVIRTAAVLGADATLLAGGASDPLYRRAVRGSMGATLVHPWARLPGLPAGLTPLRAAGFRVLALTPAPDAVPVDALGPGEGERRALLLGAEGAGLTPDALAAADVRVRIPMVPGADSLNVAAAAAIAIHVLLRGGAEEG